MAALNSMCALSTAAVELEKRKSKKAAEPGCTAASSSTERWSKETLKAVETHLSLLQKNRVPTIAAKLATSHANSPVVDFSSHFQAPMPFGWEQHLDLRTGRLYYMDWQSCKRSYNDPREALWKANERIRAIMQRAVDGERSPEPQSSVTQDDGMDVERKRFSTLCAYTKCTHLESMEAKLESSVEATSACSFIGDTEPNLLADAESKWTGEHNAAPPYTLNCTLELSSNEAYDKDDGASDIRIDSKLEILRCHYCFSNIIIHHANPWCPQCAHSLV